MIDSRRAVLAVALLAAALVSLALLFGGYVALSDRFDRKAAAANQMAELNRQKQQLQTRIRLSARIVHVLAGVPSLSAMAGDPTANAKADLRSLFKTMAESNPEIAQLRFIAADGQERIRVDRTSDGVIVLTDGALQNKSTRYYFRETIGLPPGQTYVSPIDLNVEHGKIVEPLQPVLRVAEAVTDQTNRAVGIVIGNIDVSDWLQSVSLDNSAQKRLLLDTDGYILGGGANAQFPALMGHRPPTFPDLYPEAWSRLEQGRTGQFTDDGRLYALAEIQSVSADSTEDAEMTGDAAGPRTATRLWYLADIRTHTSAAAILTTPAAMAALTLGIVLLAAGCWRISCLWYDRIEAYRAKSEAEHVAGRLESVMNTAVDGLIVIDAEGRMQAFNPACEQLFGYAAEEVLGKNVSMLMPQPYRDEHDGYLSAYHRTGEQKIIGVGREVEGRRKDGSVFPMDLAVGAFDDHGRKAFVGIIRDISERKALEEDIRAQSAELLEANRSLERFATNASRDRIAADQAKRHAEHVASRLESVMNTAVDGLIVIDAEGSMQAFNPACERLFGYAAEEVLGQNVSMLMPQPYRGEHDGYLSAYRQTGERKIIGIGREVEGRRKDGSVFPMDLAVGAFYDQGQKGFVGIVRDISERKAMEYSLQAQRDELLRSNQDLEQFAYVASHDLKSPLRAVANVASWLKEDLESKLDDEQKRLLTLVDQRITLMQELLDGILAYSRAGRHTTALEVVDPNLVVAELRDLSLLPDGFELVCDGDLPLLTTEPAPFRQVMHNLIGNAVKHHDRDHGTIRVRAADRGAFIRFSIEDDGPGIPDRHRERIFRMFERLAPKGEGSGSGIGLTLAKKLVERRGGRIAVTSASTEQTSGNAGGNRGTVFHFDWPKHEHEPVQPPGSGPRSIHHDMGEAAQ